MGNALKLKGNQFTFPLSLREIPTLVFYFGWAFFWFPVLGPRPIGFWGPCGVFLLLSWKRGQGKLNSIPEGIFQGAPAATPVRIPG